MKIVNQSFEILTPINELEILRFLEKCGRVAYQSGAKANDNSCYNFIRMIISKGHESVLEHFSITVKVITDRGITHEIVRHRIGAYTQESTRFVNYDGLTFIKPILKVDLTENYTAIETLYKKLIESGETPQNARAILPNALKTELVMTYNLRQWRHFFRTRTNKKCHPQMIQLAKIVLEKFKEQLPNIFGDIL